MRHLESSSKVGLLKWLVRVSRVSNINIMLVSVSFWVFFLVDDLSGIYLYFCLEYNGKTLKSFV